MQHSGSLQGRILFNPLKHHAGYIRNYIKQSRSLMASGYDFQNPGLREIGTSQMDLYMGNLSLEIIAEEIEEYLNDRGVKDLTAFQKWLTENKEYACVELSDKSLWVIRMGILPGKYVHIHPGRYSPQTVRVKAGALKTAIAVLIFSDSSESSIDKVNEIRGRFLGLSPVKETSLVEGIRRMLDLLG